MNGFAYVERNPLSLIDSDGRNAVLGGRFGAAGGFAIGGPVSAVVGAVAGAGVGAAIEWWRLDPCCREKRQTLESLARGIPTLEMTNPEVVKSACMDQTDSRRWILIWHPDHGAGKPHGHSWDNGRRGRIINGCPAP